MQAIAEKRFISMPAFTVNPAWDHEELRDAKAHLVARIAILDSEATVITEQLERAGWKAENGGPLPDPHWWGKATRALKFKRRERDQLRQSLRDVERRLGNNP